MHGVRVSMGKYLAFISYRHNTRDMEVSSGLRHGIENFHPGRKSSLPRKRKVFRDTDELPTSSDLGADIRNALRESDWLIAVCSEEYLQSRWCMSEIRQYISFGKKERILPVLVSGTPETSIPEEIRDLPVAADLTESRGSLKKAARDHVPQLLGRMTGEDPEALLSSHRRFRLGLTACGAGVLAAAITGFALYATKTGNEIAQNNEMIRIATEETETARQETVKETNNIELNEATYNSYYYYVRLEEGDTEEAIRRALSGIPGDLHGEKPVSRDLVGVIRSALCSEESWYARLTGTEPLAEPPAETNPLTEAGLPEVLILEGETYAADDSADHRVISAARFGDRAAVIDEDRKLRIYNLSDGSLAYTIKEIINYGFVQAKKEEKYGDVLVAAGYPDAEYPVFQPGEDGAKEIRTGSSVYTDYPSRIDYNPETKRLLIVSEKGVYFVYDYYYWKYCTVTRAEGALRAEWDTEDENAFSVTFPDRIEYYRITGEIPADLKETLPLSAEEAKHGKLMCSSPDSKYIYLRYDKRIVKCDAHNGEVIWISAEDKAGPYCGMSPGGEAFWCDLEGSETLVKIDTETGETLYTIEDISKYAYDMPLESKDGSLGLILSRKIANPRSMYPQGYEIIAIETGTGKELWRKDLRESYRLSSYTARFSEDSKEVWVLMEVWSEEGFRIGEMICRFSAEDGTLIGETVLDGESDPVREAFNCLPTGRHEDSRSFVFCGETVVIREPRVYWESDNTIMLDASMITGIHRDDSLDNVDKLIVLPDTSRIWMETRTGNSLICLSDADTVIEKARRRVGGDGF